MNVKAVIPLVAGLGIGGLALKMGINTLQNARAAQKVAKVTVWTAKTDISRGTSIREEMLQAVSFPADLVPKGAFSERDKLVGRVPRVVAPAGLPVLESMLSPPDTPPGLFVPPGYRAVAVKIDASSGVDYHLEPGAFVDVIASRRGRGNTAEMVARTLVERVEIAAVGPRLSPTTGKEAGEGDKAAAERVVRAVTLLVRPEDANRIALAEQEGPIKLSLRGFEDAEVTGKEHEVAIDEVEAPAPDENKPSPFDWVKNLLQRQETPLAPPPVVVAAAPPQHWVLRIYRGTTEELVQFKDRNSSERVDGAGGEGGPNLFGPVRKPGPGADAPRPPVAPPPAKDAQHPEPEPTLEPQEPKE